jgi:hypothetical protein
MLANEKSFELEEKLEAIKVDFEKKLKLQEEKLHSTNSTISHRFHVILNKTGP